MAPPRRWPGRGDDDETWRLLEDQWARWQRQAPRAPLMVVGLLLLGIGLIWLVTGVYTVGPGEQGVVRQAPRCTHP